MLGSCLAADELDERSCGGRDVSVLAPDEGLIAREIAVASRNGQIAGSIRIHDVSPDMTEFGLLQGVPLGLVRPSRLPDHPHQEHRRRVPPSGSAARHAVRPHGLREAVGSAGQLPTWPIMTVAQFFTGTGQRAAPSWPRGAPPLRVLGLHDQAHVAVIPQGAGRRTRGLVVIDAAI